MPTHALFSFHCMQSACLAKDDVGRLRWTRCLAELAKLSCRMCPFSISVALEEMTKKLTKVTNDFMRVLRMPLRKCVRKKVTAQFV